MRNCIYCGKPTEESVNYCSWECIVACGEGRGYQKYCPNGLPVTCVRPGALLECEHADHPDYKFPVRVDIAEEPSETHALLYTDGTVAVTLYEARYHLWVNGKSREYDGRFTAESLARVKTLCPPRKLPY